MNRLKYLREEHGLSLKDLQDNLLKDYNVKISRASLSNYEREEQTPKKETWEVLANYFKVTPSYLMGLTPQKNPIEDYFYKEGLKGLSKLVEANDNSTPYVRKSIVTLEHIFLKIKENEISLHNFELLLNLINKLTSDSDFWTWNNEGENLTNPQIINMLLEIRKDIEGVVDYFIEDAVDKNVPDYYEKGVSLDFFSLFENQPEKEEFANDLYKLLTEHYINNPEKKDYILNLINKKINRK